MALITEAYKELQKQLFGADPAYAQSGWSNRTTLRPLADYGRKPILDYGAGRQTLQMALGPAYKVIPYDPCVEGLEQTPEPCDVVYCGDVLEHIEPDCLADVLADLRRVVTGYGLFYVCLRPADKFLADGRNAHLILETVDWWRDTLIQHGFAIVDEKPAKEVVSNKWYLVA